jgi:oxygen-independent coproporphyrinogen-3 oxidase
MDPYSIYIHIPFCRHRCSYCDFNTYTGIDDLIPAYGQALGHEIRYLTEICETELPIHTIFIGGGTPSLLPAGEIEKVLKALYQGFNLLEGIEITIEANPERLSYDYLRSFYDLGINRISLGMQSAEPGELLLLERQHDFHQTANAVRMVRKAGFKNLNLDLIFGIPHQTMESWKLSLDHGISLDPDHLSLYSLTIEPDTPMETWVGKGLLPIPDEDLSAEMYELAMELLKVHHFEQYEISNWARRDEANGLLVCKHNIQYWRNHPYLGLGAGSHGYAAGKRTVNVLTPSEYVQKMMTWNERKKRERLTFPVTPATESVRAIDQREEIKETMMMGLRLTEEGISQQGFQSRFDVDLQDVYGKDIDELIDNGLLEWGNTNNRYIRLTRQGRLLGNQVFQRFI